MTEIELLGEIASSALYAKERTAMGQRTPPKDRDTPSATAFDVGAATDALFAEILQKANNPLLTTSLALLREETLATRPYEADLLPDREAEYQRLLACWRQRDKRGLQRELTAYLQRRYDIAAQVAARMDRLN
ncbi:hypothetical protein [Asticcacaulis taihuensis]